MPKDTIKGDGAQYDVVVGWRPDGDVQVGIESVGGYSLVTRLYGDPEQCTALGDRVLDLYQRARAAGQVEAALLGRQVLDAVESVGDGPCESVWATLSRQACNAAVRSLRRARDAAYGADA